MLRLVGRMMGLVWWVAALVLECRTLPSRAQLQPGQPECGTESAAAARPGLPRVQSAVSTGTRSSADRNTGVIRRHQPAVTSSLQEWPAADSVKSNVLCRGVKRARAEPGPLMWSNKLVRTSQPLCARTHVRWAALSATEQGPDWSRLELTEVRSALLKSNQNRL